MDAAAEIGRNTVISKHQIHPEYGAGQIDAGRDCRTRPERLNFQAGTCSADHEQDWQPYPVDSLLLLYMMTIHLQYHRYFQHAHFIPIIVIVGVRKRGAF